MQPAYSPFEVVLVLLLALLPGASIAQILLGVVEERTGIKVTGITNNND